MLICMAEEVDTALPDHRAHACAKADSRGHLHGNRLQYRRDPFRSERLKYARRATV